MQRWLKSRVVWLIVLLLTSAGGLAKLAGADNFTRMGRGFGPGVHWIASLELSDEQKLTLAQILDNYTGEVETVLNDINAARKEFDSLTQVDEFNEESVRDAFQKFSPALEEAMVLKSKIFAEVKTVLTPEQVGKLEQKRTEMSNKMSKRFEFRLEKLRSWLAQSKQ